MGPGLVTEKLCIFVGRLPASGRLALGDGNAAGDEDTEAFELDIDEALSWIDTGRILGGKTIMLRRQLARRLFRADAYFGAPTRASRSAGVITRQRRSGRSPSRIGPMRMR